MPQSFFFSGYRPRARFMNAPETFQAIKGVFSQSVSKNREVYKTSCMERTSVCIKNMLIKQLYNHKIWDFATAFRVRKLLGTFEKRFPERTCVQ